MNPELKTEIRLRITPGYDCLLRKGRPQDIPQIATLLEDCAGLLAERGLTHWRTYQVNGPNCEKDVDSGRLYCLLHEGKVVATFTLAENSPPYAKGRFEEYWIEPDATACFLKKLAVSPRFDGKDVGKTLLVEAERIARKVYGAEYLRIDINPHVRALINYATKVGFEHRADLDIGVLYEKRLS